MQMPDEWQTRWQTWKTWYERYIGAIGLELPHDQYMALGSRSVISLTASMITMRPTSTAAASVESMEDRRKLVKSNSVAMANGTLFARQPHAGFHCLTCPRNRPSPKTLVSRLSLLHRISTSDGLHFFTNPLLRNEHDDLHPYHVGQATWVTRVADKVSRSGSRLASDASHDSC